MIIHAQASLPGLWFFKLPQSGVQEAGRILYLWLCKKNVNYDDLFVAENLKDFDIVNHLLVPLLTW